MDFKKQLEIDGVDSSNYYELRKKKKELLHVLNAYDTFWRFIRLRVKIPDWVYDALGSCTVIADNGDLNISMVHKYIKYITDLMNNIKKGSNT